MESDSALEPPIPDRNSPVERSSLGSFWVELKQRKVVRAAITYLVVGLAVMEGGDIILGNLGAPQWVVTSLILLVIAGFPITLVTSWVYDLTPGGIQNTDTAREEESKVSGKTSTGPAQSGLLLFVAAAVPTLIFGAATIFFFLRAKIATDELVFVTKAQVEEMTEQSIAVLPFDHRSNLEEDLFFTDGFHDELITQISKIRELRTIARTSVMSYRDTTKRMTEIGEELNVRYLVEGGVQRGGDEIRIVVQLIDTATEGHVWTEVYTRAMSAKNVFDIQSEISHEIARELQILLSPAEEEQINKLPTENLAALEAYFKGKELMENAGSVVEIEAAIKFYEKAVSLDPEFVLPHVFLGGCQIFLTYMGQFTRNQQWEKAQVHLDRALEIDLDHPRALYFLAWLEERKGNLLSAVEMMEKVIRISPNFADAHARLARWVYTLTGNNEERIRHSGKAYTLDPSNPRNDTHWYNLLIYKGEWKEALSYQKSRASENPRNANYHGELAKLYFRNFGRCDEAIIAFRKQLELDPRANLIELESCYYHLGDSEQAIAWLEKHIGVRPPESGFSRGVRQMIHLYKGNDILIKESALKVLEKNPKSYGALLWATNLDLKQGNVDLAISRLRNAYPRLFDPVVEITPAAIGMCALVAVALTETGENEPADRLATKILNLHESMGRRRHFDLLDQVYAYHAKGNEDDTLNAIQRYFDVGGSPYQLELRYFLKPYFDHPEYLAMVEKRKAELAIQLERIRTMEANGELAPLPEHLRD